MKQSKYYLSAFTAFFIWGFFSFGLKPLHDYPSLDILFYRVFFSVVLMSLLNILFRKKVLKQNWVYFKGVTSVQKRNILLLTLGGGLLLTSNWLVFIYVMNHISVKAASLAYLICPIITTVFGFLILSEKLTKIQWSAVGISLVSCVLLSLNHYEDIFYSLIVAVTYALYLVSQKKNAQIDKFLLLNIQLLLTALLILPFFPKYTGAIPTENHFYVYIMIIVVFFTIIPLFLNLFALKGINSSAVGIMIYINPLINFMLAIFYYNENVTDLQLISYSLIIVAIVVFNHQFLLGQKSKLMAVKDNVLN